MCSRVLGTTKVWGSTDTTSTGRRKSEPQPPPELKILRLTNSMNPRFISLQILLALKCSSFNGIYCSGLNLLDDLSSTCNSNAPRISSKNRNHAEDDNDLASTTGEDEESASEGTTPGTESYLEHLKALIYSRNWLQIEFDQCKGVETLFDVTRHGNDGNGESPDDATKLAVKRSVTIQVDCVSLTFPRSSKSASNTYDEEPHARFFTNIFNQWRVRKLQLAMEFTPSWTKEFCLSLSNDDNENNEKHLQNYSGLEELKLHPTCKWHRRSKTTKTEDENDCSMEHGSAEHIDDANGKSSGKCDPLAKKKGEDVDKVIDCWELFCRQLPLNHPRLRTLEILCKASDEDLAYLIVNGISSPSFLALDTLKFGTMCSFDEQSLIALAHAFTMTTRDAIAPCLPQRLQNLSLCRGTKLPSPCSSLVADAIHREQRGLMEFCRALAATSALTHLTLCDYVLDQAEMRVLFQSLVQSRGNIERLSLFYSAVTSSEAYETFVECLRRNELPFLEVLLLPDAASGYVRKALQFNTSIQYINCSGHRSPSLSLYLDLNRGGRRILTTAAGSEAENDTPNIHRRSILSNIQPAISPALYPQILNRASHAKKYGYIGGDKRKYDVVYCLLRNRILLEV